MLFFKKFFAALNYENSLTLAGELLDELQLLALTDEDYLMRLQSAENLFNTYSLEFLGKYKNNSQANIESGTTEVYSLSENYPNPFNPSTIIRYQIPQDGIVTLKIYDILGAEVATLVNEEKVAGKYEVNFNASHLASGVYVYRISAGSFTASKKLILLK